MLVEKQEVEKRKEFQKILWILSKRPFKDDRKLVLIYKRLEKLYKNDFRHYYVDIFQVLAKIKNSNGANGLGIDTLGENVLLLKNSYEDCKTRYTGELGKKDISDNLKKLLDHVSLDIARIRFYTGEDENIVGMDTIGNIEKLLNETNERVRITERKSEESTKKLEESTKKLEKVQQESIAILSIFAAVILAFTGGLSFLGKGVDIIENIDVKIENVTFVLGVGGVLFLNLLFGMFKFISAILDKEFGFKCLIGLNIIVVVALVLLIWLRGLYTI